MANKIFTDGSLKTLVDETKSYVDDAVSGKSDSGHTHNYAGSSSSGGAATSANKLNTNAGSTTQPVYFENGVPKATTYSLGKSVPSDAKFTDTVYTLPAAGSSLGGVKSGGDVTISSDGVITVNDDSHNHTISNVDNLQTTLDGKAPTSHASTATTYGIGTSSNYGHVKLSDATNSTSSTSAGIAATPAAVKAAYDKANHSHPYLSTSGGTISGVITTTNGGAFNSDVTTSGTFYYGGTNFNEGAFLGLYGKDQSNYAGQFRLKADDGESFVYLEGMPSGHLRWNNKTVATLGTDGALAIADGGTGVRYEPSMLVNLASTSASGIFETYPRPGVTGVLGVANGGTGINNATPVVYASSKPSSPVTGVIYAIPI